MIFRPDDSEKVYLQGAIHTALHSCRLACHLAAQPVYVIGSNLANFRNFSMKYSDHISEICIFRNA